MSQWPVSDCLEKFSPGRPSHPVPPAGGEGWGEWQVTCYPSISLSTPIYFAIWPISTPGGGMSMWLLPFLWRTITGRCWPVVLKLPSQLGIWVLGVWYALIFGKITSSLKLMLPCLLRENLASRRGPSGRFYSAKEAPKPRWDRNSYVCGRLGHLFKDFKVSHFKYKFPAT